MPLVSRDGRETYADPDIRGRSPRTTCLAHRPGLAPDLVGTLQAIMAGRRRWYLPPMAAKSSNARDSSSPPFLRLLNAILADPSPEPGESVDSTAVGSAPKHARCRHEQAFIEASPGYL